MFTYICYDFRKIRNITEDYIKKGQPPPPQPQYNYIFATCGNKF